MVEVLRSLGVRQHGAEASESHVATVFVLDHIITSSSTQAMTRCAAWGAVCVVLGAVLLLPELVHDVRSARALQVHTV